MSADYAIETRAIKKSFAGVQALRGVDLKVRRGDIHALLGQNGAGKSTLIKIMNGVYRAGTYEGEMLHCGKPCAFRSPDDARSAGIGYVPQEIEVLDQLTVAENVFAGHMGVGSMRVNRALVLEKTREIFAEMGITINPRAIVASLTGAQRHLVMIARTISANPDVLMLDEPTSSLSGQEVSALFAVLRRLKAQGKTIIYITHRLPEVLDLCDHATVLRDGRVGDEFDRAVFDQDKFIFAMSGRRLQQLFPERTDAPTEHKMLEVEGLTVPGHTGAIYGARGVSFHVAAGEIVGLAGLLGSGRSEILHGIYGRVPATGTIRVDGAPVRIASPRDARAAGIALLTEDRKHDGLLFNLPIGMNITMGNLSGFSSYGFISADREMRGIKEAMRELSVKAPSATSSVAQLSGGNQQKLLFARVLMQTPRILLLDEPSKGVDAATRAEIYRLIVELAGKGVALLVVSSELEELIGLCDRCLTVADGEIVGEFRRGEGDEERIMREVTEAQARNLALVKEG